MRDNRLYLRLVQHYVDTVLLSLGPGGNDSIVQDECGLFKDSLLGGGFVPPLMQLQLSLAVADRLHETLLVRGAPLDAHEAACLLTASAECPPALSHRILDALVAEDRRFCWTESSGDGASTLASGGPAAAGDVEEPCEGACEARDRRICLCHWQAADPDLLEVPFVALDLETTGARTGTSKITEIGAVRIEGLREVATFHTLVNPMRSIPRMITEITGITQEMVADAPRIEQVIPELLEFLRGAVVVAHNAGFDVGFLNYELRRLKGRELGDGAIDTLPLARALAPGLVNYKLATVAESLGAPVAACHRALADAQAAGHVFVTLMSRLREQGVTRLSEARAFMVSSARAATEKLALTRELPLAPGAYRFVDRDGRVIYVGHGERLQEQVRSHFTGMPSNAGKMRQAIRLVERIEWEETHTPLEAILREHQLILEHRPSCNQHGVRPETYAYLKVRQAGPGLCLYVSSRTPRTLVTGDPGSKGGSSHQVLGPFRGRSRLISALDLLQRCYPIRDCPRQPQARPCDRGRTGGCLAPCLGDPAIRRRHDRLVRQILSWLGGRTDGDLVEPARRVEELAAELAEQKRYEEVQKLRQSWEDLLSVRRSYSALADASKLRFAALWPQESNGDGPTVRLNLIWDGRLCSCVSLRRENLRQDVDAALSGCIDEGQRPGEAGRVTGHEAATRRARNCHVAVWQHEVDPLLAVRRWLKEAAGPDAVIITASGPVRAHSDEWRDRLVAEALRMLDS